MPQGSEESPVSSQLPDGNRVPDDDSEQQVIAGSLDTSRSSAVSDTSSIDGDSSPDDASSGQSDNDSPTQTPKGTLRQQQALRETQQILDMTSFSAGDKRTLMEKFMGFFSPRKPSVAPEALNTSADSTETLDSQYNPDDPNTSVSSDDSFSPVTPKKRFPQDKTHSSKLQRSSTRQLLAQYKPALPAQLANADWTSKLTFEAALRCELGKIMHKDDARGRNTRRFHRNGNTALETFCSDTATAEEKSAALQYLKGLLMGQVRTNSPNARNDSDLDWNLLNKDSALWLTLSDERIEQAFKSFEGSEDFWQNILDHIGQQKIYPGVPDTLLSENALDELIAYFARYRGELGVVPPSAQKTDFALAAEVPFFAHRWERLSQQYDYLPTLQEAIDDPERLNAMRQYNGTWKVFAREAAARHWEMPAVRAGEHPLDVLLGVFLERHADGFLYQTGGYNIEFLSKAMPLLSMALMRGNYTVHRYVTDYLILRLSLDASPQQSVLPTLDAIRDALPLAYGAIGYIFKAQVLAAMNIPLQQQGEGATPQQLFCHTLQTLLAGWMVRDLSSADIGFADATEWLRGYKSKWGCVHAGNTPSFWSLSLLQVLHDDVFTDGAAAKGHWMVHYLQRNEGILQERLSASGQTKQLSLSARFNASLNSDGRRVLQGFIAAVNREGAALRRVHQAVDVQPLLSQLTTVIPIKAPSQQVDLTAVLPFLRDNAGSDAKIPLTHERQPTFAY